MFQVRIDVVPLEDAMTRHLTRWPVRRDPDEMVAGLGGERLANLG
jgi:hypothetical protein